MSFRPFTDFIHIGALRKGALATFALLLAGCTQLFFFPQRGMLDSPERYGVKYEVEDFKAADGVSLNAWFFPAQGKEVTGRDEAPKPTVLFLHGNAENISTHFRSIAWLPAEGYNVLALDYRGYGASEGQPTLAGIMLDIDAAMGRLQAHAGVDPKRIVIYGQSLGGALAVHYAAHTAYRSSVRALVIDSAFYDYRQISREKLAGSALTWAFQWLPWLAIDDDYSPAKSIAAIAPMPLLLIQGDKDAVVPPRHAQELFEHAGEPKQLWIVPGAGHTQALGSAEVRKRLVEYLKRYTG